AVFGDRARGLELASIAGGKLDEDRARPQGERRLESARTEAAPAPRAPAAPAAAPAGPAAASPGQTRVAARVAAPVTTRAKARPAGRVAAVASAAKAPTAAQAGLEAQEARGEEERETATPTRAPGHELGRAPAAPTMGMAAAEAEAPSPA